MNYLELKQTFLESYNLGDGYCRSLYAKGGVCILVQEKLKFARIDLTKLYKDKDLEVCAAKIYLNSRRICIIAIYRAPSGNFDFFINKLDIILKKLFKANAEFIICGDININFLVESGRKHQLAALLKTYNLMSRVNFLTRIRHNSSMAIDNFFIDVTMVVIIL
jgi:exonuclease III